MHELKGVLLSLVIVGPLTVSLSVSVGADSSAKAQNASQTLAQCVKELDDVYPLYVDSEVFRKHTKVCLDNLATQTPTESLGQCVAGMKSIYPLYVGSKVTAIHTQNCSDLLTAQRANSKQQVQPIQNGTILVVPGASVSSPQQFASCVNAQMYKQREVCIDPWGDIDESCFYRGRGGRKTITEPTGVDINQARAICGG